LATEGRSAREFDVVVWGASAFVGKLVVEYLLETYRVGKDLRWAIAGRNRDKLEAVLREAGQKPDAVPIVLADSHDKSSLKEMARRTKVVCTLVGPFALYGSELVEACIEERTDYCDLTGEVFWVRDMIRAHEAAARERGVHIVNACGFDALPSDLGNLLVQKAMHDRHGVYSRDVSMRVTSFAQEGFSGGTAVSAINVMKQAASSKDMMNIAMDANALVPAGAGVDAPGTDVKGPRWEPEIGAWSVPYLLAAFNSQIVRRSNALAGFPYGHDFRYGEGTTTGPGIAGWLRAVAATVSMYVFATAAMLRPTRALLQRLLRKPGEGPSKEARENGHYRIIFTARHPEEPSTMVQVQIDGERDPGYGSACRMITECAVSLALDEEIGKVPGGFWTPASCLGERLIERLQQNAGIRFKILPAVR
jgi:short subunit dehydrogenase-like uncharacterized protein